MNLKEKMLTFFILMISITILFIFGMESRIKNSSKNIYQVYLDGKQIGLIDNSDDLLNMIDSDQTDIKNTYHVDKVYPPNGFIIEKYTTYNEEVTPSNEIYKIVKEKGDFTIKGYVITITDGDKEEHPEQIYVLDDQIFKNALEKVVTAFIEEEKFKNYNNNTQEEIAGVGEIIKYMSFNKNPTIKETNISVKEKIYTNELELTQYLLFGKDKIEKKYTVKKGDTIESIAENNKLNVNEFLIANPKYKSAESLLTINEEVSVELVNPLLDLIEEMHAVEDVEQIFEKKQIIDYNKPSEYKEITQTGVTGIVRMTKEYKKTNGESNQGVIILNSTTIREKVDEITTVGKPSSFGTPWETGKDWGWPTNKPYVFSSPFGYRQGGFHEALDISGPGFGSPIYAAMDGVIIETTNICPNIGYYRNPCGMTYGNHVLIDHENGYYSMYAHLTQNVKVNIGDRVERGNIIGYMGSSGSSDGTHLHFGISVGKPFSGKGRWINPLTKY